MHYKDSASKAILSVSILLLEMRLVGEERNISKPHSRQIEWERNRTMMPLDLEDVFESICEEQKG